ncbi:ABC transporter substrate-binding protein [Embleya sp. NPDC020630]|uniref:ABC transporter substrate-binding protein n=1 Tax=Embleya sp. NPDC020630 TaxID=3363979 RepID=UPI00379F6F12
MNNRKRPAAVALATAAVLWAAGCSASDDAVANKQPAPAGAAVDGGTLRVGLDRPFGRLDPADSALTSQPMLLLANSLFDPLMVNDKDGQVRPYLAKSFTPNADASSWTLDLRDGVKFANGRPLDARAVIDHVQRLAKPESKCPCAVDAATIAGMTASSPTSVRIDLKNPDAALPNLFTRALGYIATAPTDSSPPVGSGPFTVEQSQPGVSVTVTRNPGYWGDKPHVDKVVYRVLPDADSRYQSVRSGDVDLIWAETPNHLRQSGTDGLRTATALGATSTTIFNTKVAPFDDPRVRRAMQYTIDRATLAKVVTLDQGKPADGPLVSTAPYRSATPYPAPDPAKARQLLAEVGAPVRFDYLVPTQPEAQQRATVLQQMLGDVGIHMTIKPLDVPTYLSTLYQRQFQVADFTTSAFGDPSTGLNMFFGAGSPTNFAGFADPALDTALATGRGALDPARRGAAYADAGRVLVEQAPALFLTENRVGFIAAAKVGGLPDLAGRSVVNVSPAALWVTR